MTTHSLLRTPGRPFVVLLSGITGSGKSTLAERLSHFGVERVSVDELVFDAHGAYGRDYPETEYLPYEREALAVAEDQVASHIDAGRDVVLDHGLWKASDRQAMTQFASDRSAVPVHVSFPVDRSEVERRLRERNKRTDAHALFVSDSALDDFYARYDPVDTLAGSVVDGTAELGEVVRGIRLATGRAAWTNDPLTDLVLDQLLCILARLEIQVDDIESDAVAAMDSLDVAELTVAIERKFDAPLSPGDILVAASAGNIARRLRGLLRG